MSQIQLSLFYDYQLLIQNSNFYRKYHLLFKSLDLSEVKDKNYSIQNKSYQKPDAYRLLIFKSCRSRSSYSNGST
jgi:hypothetical protein